MSDLILFSCLLCQFMMISSNSPDSNSELVFSFKMQRHGDRTPSRKEIRYSTNPGELERLVEPYGFKQLTEKGMYNCYILGRYIRDTYDSHLGPKYNKSKVYFRAADGSRTKMSMLTCMAGIYPPVKKWHKDINWTPVPYDMVPKKFDFNSANKNCPVLIKAIKKMKKHSCNEMLKYQEVLDLMSSEIDAGFNVTEKPLRIIDIYNVLADQVSLGLPLTPALQAKWDDITAAAVEAYNILYHKNNYSPYVTGVLLHEFFKYADRAIEGDRTPRMRIYTAHQDNLYTFTKITKTEINRYPTFVSAFTLDLRREGETGRIFVEPVFASLDSNGGVSHGVYSIKGCGKRCYYDEFVKLTKNDAWDYRTWRDNCGAEDSIEM